MVNAMNIINKWLEGDIPVSAKYTYKSLSLEVSDIKLAMHTGDFYSFTNGEGASVVFKNIVNCMEESEKVIIQTDLEETVTLYLDYDLL